MPIPRRLLALALLLPALPGAGVLAGCGGEEEDSAAVAIAHSGLLGGWGEQLKREDDEAETAERRADAPQTREERLEAREAAEDAAAQAGPPAGAESPSPGEEDEEGSGGDE
jgi:hypothetical protein